MFLKSFKFLIITALVVVFVFTIVSRGLEDRADIPTITIECRTAFDSCSGSQNKLSDEFDWIWSSLKRGFKELFSDQPSVKIIYRVVNQERVAEKRKHVFNEFPARLIFPQNNSQFCAIPVWINELTDASGEVSFLVADVPVTVGPQQQVRVGALFDKEEGSWLVTEDEDKWEDKLHEALNEGYPAAVWIFELELKHPEF